MNLRRMCEAGGLLIVLLFSRVHYLPARSQPVSQVSPSRRLARLSRLCSQRSARVYGFPLNRNCPSRSFPAPPTENCSRWRSKTSLAAPARSTESSDELSVAAAVEGMSLTSRGSHEPQPEMPPGVGNAPDVQGTASDVVEGEGRPARHGGAGMLRSPERRWVDRRL